jgi:molybdopterin synthase sulfur carrier subunit
MIRVVLPHHLRTLARVGAEVQLEIDGPASPSAILDALESRYPMLKGTIRDYQTQKRRPLLRFYACGEDLSFAPPDAPLPEAIAKGEEPFLIWGAVAGG